MQTDGFNAKDTILDQRMVTSLSTAVAVTWAPSGSRCVEIECEDQPIRLWENGTNPTTLSGKLLNPGDAYKSYIGDFTKLIIIETTPSAKCSVTCRS